MNWFYAAIASVSALALAELTQQHILKQENEVDESVSGTLTFLFQSLLTLPIIFIMNLQGEMGRVFQADTILNLICVTIVASIGMIFYLRSFKVVNISYSSIFISFSSIISTSLGIIFLSESVSLYKFVGIFLVLISIVSLNINNAALEKNHLYGILAGIFFGIMYTLDKSIVTKTHPLIYIFWAFFLVSVFGFIVRPVKMIQVVKGLTLKDFTPIFISGFGYFIYNLCTFIAYSLGGEVGKVDAINNSQVFLIILAEFFIFKQKDGVFRKIITALIAFLGVAILGYL